MTNESKTRNYTLLEVVGDTIGVTFLGLATYFAYEGIKQHDSAYYVLGAIPAMIGGQIIIGDYFSRQRRKSIQSIIGSLENFTQELEQGNKELEKINKDLETNIKERSS